MFRILIVDDSKAVHAYVKHCFIGLKEILTHSVYNGQEAVDYLATDSKFDLVLLDWEMPVLTGPEAFEKIKKMNLAVPIVMMTSRNDMEDLQKMIAAGVAEYIMKPFTLDILLEKIDLVTGAEFSNVS